MNDDGGIQYWQQVGQWEQDITTTHVRPPVPTTAFDWQATRQGAEPGDLVGFGPTEQAAINDLIEQEQA